VARGRANLEALGFRVREPRNLLASHGHLAGRVEQRVDDIHELWRDPEVKALWALRGGYGAAALLPHLDYALMRREPKALIGFSDITALHLALLGQAGLVSFHGPVATSPFTPYTRAALQAVLMQAQPAPPFGLADEQRRRARTDAQYRSRTLHAGRASGPLVGGNLSVLSALVGTPYAPDIAQALLFLEDVGETPARVDRMLTQLQLALGLQHSAALMAGVFDRCEAARGEASLSLAQVLDERLGSAGVPAVYGWSFGHVRDQLTLPLGVPALLDTDSETLTLLEPAVA
jgi:muramoyltetrapeptide carboxypeptidase